MLAAHSGIIAKVKNALPWTPANSTGVKAWTDAKATATYGSGRVTALANYITGSPAFYSDYGPVINPSTYFPRSLPVIQFLDPSVVGSNAAGIYARIFDDVSANSIAPSSISAVLSSRKAKDTSSGRVMSYSPTTADDYTTVGAWWLQTDTGGINFQFVTLGASSSYPSIPFTVTQFQPFDVRVDTSVGPNPTATLYVNSVLIGTLTLGAVMSQTNSRIGFARSIHTDGDLWYGELACVTAQFGTHTTNDDNKLAGYRSWYAMGSGALLPTGHPYKNRAPLTSDP